MTRHCPKVVDALLYPCLLSEYSELATLEATERCIVEVRLKPNFSHGILYVANKFSFDI